jgi:hypothetical protein
VSSGSSNCSTVSFVCVCFELSATICFPVSFLLPASKLVVGGFVDVLMGGLVKNLMDGCVDDVVGGFVDDLVDGCVDDLVGGFVGGFDFSKNF